MNHAKVARAIAFPGASQESPEESEWSPRKEVHSGDLQWSSMVSKSEGQPKQETKRMKHPKRTLTTAKKSAGFTQTTKRTEQSGSAEAAGAAAAGDEQDQPQAQEVPRAVEMSITRKVKCGNDSVTLEYTTAVTKVTEVEGGHCGGAFPEEALGNRGSWSQMYNEASYML